MRVDSKTIKELKETIAFVVLLAPDRFTSDDRLDLESGFIEINNGIEYCKDMIDNEGVFVEIKKMSGDAEKAYKMETLGLGRYCCSKLEICLPRKCCRRDCDDVCLYI